MNRNRKIAKEIARLRALPDSNPFKADAIKHAENKANWYLVRELGCYMKLDGERLLGCPASSPRMTEFRENEAYEIDFGLLTKTELRTCTHVRKALRSIASGTKLFPVFSGGRTIFVSVPEDDDAPLTDADRTFKL